MRRPAVLIRTAAVMIVATIATLVSQPSAHASDERVELVKNGAVKAIATYNDGPDKFCVRAFGTAEAWASIAVYVYFPDGTRDTRHAVVDHAGDDSRTCKHKSEMEGAGREDERWVAFVFWSGAGNAQRSAEMIGYY